jgi:hypothetical protein
MPVMTVEEYESHQENYDGFCKICNEVTREGDTEPDADSYECPKCENHSCVGMQLALVVGLIVLDDEEE